MENINFNNDNSYFKPTAEELAKVQQSCVPLNTTRCTEKWINILNSWRNHQNNDKYSRASLKNAVASISRHLKNSIPYWNYNLLDKNSFPKLYATLDGTLKEIKRLKIGAAKLHEGLTNEEICLLGCPRGGEHYKLLIDQFEDTEKGFIFKKFQQKNDQGGLEGNQHTFEILFTSNIADKVEPNADIRKYISMRPPNCTTKEFYLGISNASGQWYLNRALGKKRSRGMFQEICLVCDIDISGRNISNHSGRDTAIQSIFDAGNEEIEAMAISEHNSSAGVRNYLKVTKEKKRNILNSVVQRLTESNTCNKDELPKSNTINKNEASKDKEPPNSGFSKASQLLNKKIKGHCKNFLFPNQIRQAKRRREKQLS
ncbi:unnamed protein product [Rhizophagus irregularis]|nr:unnamed protein product [Rhizophagus irregularis]